MAADSAQPGYLDDHLALQEVMNAYCTAVDSLGDMDAMLDVFTPDAEFDLSAIGLTAVHGHDGIRGFFEGVFNDMTHHAHYWSNFHIDELNGDDAKFRAYVNAMGRARDGNTVNVQVLYKLTCRRIDGRWKVTRFYEEPLMPMPGSLTEIHGHR